MEIVVAIIAGASSIIGGALGAWWASNQQEKDWLRRNQSESFAKFLELLARARDEGTDALHDKSLPELERNIRVTVAYSAPEHYAQVVRFYLPENSKKEIPELVRSIRGLHASVDLGDSRHHQIEQKLDQIQKLLEDAIAG